MNEQTVIPTGWEAVSLGDVVAPSTQKAEPSEFGDSIYIGLENIESGTNRIIATGDVDSVKSTKAVFRAGDVLYGKLRPYLNKVCRPPFNGVCSTDILVFPQIPFLDSGYLLHFLSSPKTIDFANQNASGINLPRIGASALSEIDFPLPPLPEQRRIVAKIEALQERSRKAREALAEVGPLLEQFRQSLLAAAFRGDLTADWRAANPNVEPASELLNRIRQERRQKWEQAELAKYDFKGKQPPKDWKTEYQQPESTDGTGLPELPKSWCWTRVEEVCAYITKGTTPPKESMTQDRGDVRFLKVGNLTFSGALDFSKENAYIDSGAHNSGVYARSRVYPGDVLMNLVGPPLGKVSVIPTDLEQSNVNQAIAIFRPLVGLNCSYLTMVLTTPSILDRIISRAKQTSGQRNLTLDLARGLPIPLAPIAEQLELARRLDQSLSTIENLKTNLASSEAELMQLNQSILAKAFRGELVPQDPSDEPASELLARIRATRKATQAANPAMTRVRTVGAKL
jgi:type I restriction enzyme S subunit